ncbi:hypothetical protein ACFYVR_15900 [Rhodococcus sp. NPDC003318]|uniref:hypothetical protein n=1 Tax=Rhodococcus sp. NPDC003318 TaxID=3364503 RepID=UPI0036B572BB
MSQLALFDDGIDTEIPAWKINSSHLGREICIAGRWARLRWLLHHASRGTVEMQTVDRNGPGHCLVDRGYLVGVRAEEVRP